MKDITFVILRNEVFTVTLPSNKCASQNQTWVLIIQGESKLLITCPIKLHQNQYIFEKKKKKRRNSNKNQKTNPY